MKRTASVASLLVASTAAAQSPTVLVRSGDSVVGAGTVVAVEQVAIAPGQWAALVETDAQPGASAAVVRNGALHLRQGDALAAPAGASVLAFEGPAIDAAGEIGQALLLAGPPAGLDTGVYLGATLVLQSGATTTCPEFTPGTRYLGLQATAFAPGRQFLVAAYLDDPAIPEAQDAAVVRLSVAASGAITAETLLLKEGDALAGVAGRTIAAIGSPAGGGALNAAGVALYSAVLTGSTDADGVILRDTTVVAREGDPSPVAGRAWAALYQRALDISDTGRFAFRAALDGSASEDEVVVRDATTVIAREGASFASIAPWSIASFGDAPVRVDAGGRVYWYARWNHPDPARGAGLFRDGELLVEDGVTTAAGGVLVERIADDAHAFAITPDGGQLVFRARLADGSEAALRLELADAGEPFCFGDGSGAPCPCGNAGSTWNGCANSVFAIGANLRTSGASSLASDALTLVGSAMPDSSALYFQGTTRLAGGSGAAFGDGLRCAAGAIVRLATKFNVAGGSRFPDAGDPTVSARGLVAAPGVRTYQVWYRNAAAFCTASTFNLTNGVSVTWMP